MAAGHEEILMVAKRFSLSLWPDCVWADTFCNWVKPPLISLRASDKGVLYLRKVFTRVSRDQHFPMSAIFATFVEDSVTMKRYFENHVRYFVQNRRKYVLLNSISV